MRAFGFAYLLLAACCGLVISCTPGSAVKGDIKKVEMSTLGKPPLAFIFINSGYRGESLHSPIKASDEAASLAFHIRTYGGFDVENNYEIVKKERFEEYLKTKFRDKIQGRSRILFFFVGHGYGKVENDTYEDFLIPTQAPLRSGFDKHINEVSYGKLMRNCINVRQLVNEVSVMMDKGQFCLFHFNACRGAVLPGDSSNWNHAINRPKFPRNVSVAFSTQDGTVSYQGHGRRTPYTHAFVSGMAATPEAVKFSDISPTKSAYYSYGHFHDILERQMEAEESWQAPEIWEGNGGRSISYSTVSLTWAQYKQWREVSTGNLDNTPLKLRKTTDAMGGSFVRKKPEDAFEDKSYVIQGLSPAALNLMLDHLYKHLIEQSIPPETFFTTDFIRNAKRQTNLWGDEQFLLVCDLVIPGLRDHLSAPVPAIVTEGNGPVGSHTESVPTIDAGPLSSATSLEGTH